ncbi:hypothetical protein D3C76_1459230 [compost metagenome]
MHVQYKADALHLVVIQVHRPGRVALPGPGVGAARNTQDTAGLFAGRLPFIEHSNRGAQAGGALILGEQRLLQSSCHVHLPRGLPVVHVSADT